VQRRPQKHFGDILVDKPNATGSGQVRSFHVEGPGAADRVPIIKAIVAKETAVMTDEGGHYCKQGEHFASHESGLRRLTHRSMRLRRL
jgi:hypothetical protein